MSTAADELVGGRYVLGELLGRGGSATVHRARDRRTGREVALKRFAPGIDGPDRHRQEQEVRTLARLDHPGLVRLLDAGDDDGRAWIAMPLVEGPTLARRLADGPLPVDEVLGLGAAVADALAHVHARGVSHRDLKPANVLLDPDRGALVADFGIALLVDATRVTATDAVVGTAAYMAPEQLAGATAGAAADVYALGLVLLEACSGARAFPGTGMEAVLARLHSSPRVPDTLPRPLRDLIAAMTATRPERRPLAGQVAARLTALAGGDPAPPPRRRLLVGGLAAGTAALLAALAVLLLPGAGPGPAPGAPVPGVPAAPAAPAVAAAAPAVVPGSVRPTPAVAARGAAPTPSGSAAAPAPAERTGRPAAVATPRGEDGGEGGDDHGGRGSSGAEGSRGHDD